MIYSTPIGRSVLFGGVIGVALFGIWPAFAQSTPLPGVPGGKNVTCREFLRLGAARENEVLYFANGYAAGVEDQVAEGTPSTSTTGSTTSGMADSTNALVPTAGSAAPSKSLSQLTHIDIDQLRVVCRTALNATVISEVPGGSPVSGSGTITGDTSNSSSGGTSGASAADDGSTTTGAVRDTTSASAGTSASSAAAQALSDQMSVTSPAHITTDAATGLVHATPGATMSTGAAPTMQAVTPPTAGAAPGGEIAAPGSTPSVLVPAAVSPSAGTSASGMTSTPGASSTSGTGASSTGAAR